MSVCQCLSLSTIRLAWGAGFTGLTHFTGLSRRQISMGETDILLSVGSTKFSFGQCAIKCIILAMQMRERREINYITNFCCVFKSSSSKIRIFILHSMSTLSICSSSNLKHSILHTLILHSPFQHIPMMIEPFLIMWQWREITSIGLTFTTTLSTGPSRAVAMKR